MRPALLLAALALCVCGPSPLEFPVGFFGVETPEDAAALKGQGFNAIQSYRDDPAAVAALAAEARRRGQLLLVSPRGVMARARAAAEFPGVAWYLQDEPDAHGVSRDQLAALERRVKAWAPGSRTAFVVGDGGRAKDYPGVGDAIMVDWYPVPHLPLESAGDHVRRTAEAAAGRPVWAVLQAMNWRDFPQRDPKKPRIGRFPDLAEIRFMSYDAVLNGASGVWYFVYTLAPGINLSRTPELLLPVARCARELRAMAPIFARGRPIPLPFPPDPDGVCARAWTYRGRDYVVLANRRKPVMVQVPKPMLGPAWRPLFENRRDPRRLLHPEFGAYYLRPYQVLVLEGRFRWRRLLGL